MAKVADCESNSLIKHFGFWLVLIFTLASQHTSLSNFERTIGCRTVLLLKLLFFLSLSSLLCVWQCVSVLPGCWSSYDHRVICIWFWIPAWYRTIKDKSHRVKIKRRGLFFEFFHRTDGSELGTVRMSFWQVRFLFSGFSDTELLFWWR